MKWFDFARKSRVKGADGLYFLDGKSEGSYFNYIPREKVGKYTNITEISILDNSVFVECENLNTVNCAIIFCTYKREKYIVKNVNYLLENLKKQSDFEWEIIVVDNAK